MKIRKREYGSINVYKATRLTTNSFVRNLGQLFKKDKQRKNYIDFCNFIDSILLEAAAYRNMVVHSGYYNERLKIKIEQCLPIIVRKFRVACLVLIIKNNNRKDFDRLLIKKVEAKSIYH